jgi:flagellar biosynthesis chaperone FliJ
MAMHREKLDVLRQDLLRLNQICAEAERKLRQAELAQTDFLDETRHSERSEALLYVDQMRDRRRYLAHLQKLAEDVAKTHEEAARQQAMAQDAFETCHKEIKKLERLAERRVQAARLEQQRQDYLRADDEELVRSQQIRGAYEFG